jgi:hypothetical protein
VPPLVAEIEGGIKRNWQEGNHERGWNDGKSSTDGARISGFAWISKEIRGN